MENKENTIKYDLTVLLADEDASFVEDYIKNEGGSDINTDVTKIDFAYDVSGLSQGYMAVITFVLDSESSQNLLKRLKNDSNVLRHMLLRDTVKKDKSSDKKASRGGSKTSRKSSDNEEHLSNEAIEQKIEEILD